MGKSTVDLNKFKCVKILLESGATYEEIIKMTDVSSITITRIKKAQSYEEYRHNLRAQAAAYAAKHKQIQQEADRLLNEEIRKQREVARQEEAEKQRAEDRKNERVNNAMANNYQINRLVELVREQNEILKVMSNKLAFIVDELTR